MGIELDEAITAQWEDGELGRDEQHVRKVAADDVAQMEAALSMKLVTMRLPIPLIKALKEIAQYHGVGYQPMVRDLLTRFAMSEAKMIWQNEVARLQDMQAVDASPAVDAFFERERKVA